MAQTAPIRLLLTGGGTGGHLFPALASADEVCRRYPGTEVLFIGTKRKMDRASLERCGYRVSSIHCYGLKGKNIVELIKALVVLPLSLVESIFQIFRFRPDVVLGVGGYVTGPVMLAAKLLGKKTVIHEQNSIPGLANRKLGPIVDKICLSLPESGKFFPKEKTVFTGNPVRKAILDLAQEEGRTLDDSEKITLLVLGGSQGAHRVNELVVEALLLLQFGNTCKVIHQTGGLDYEWVKKKYSDGNIEANVAPFFHDMTEVYRDADFLVSRAGATTLAEISVLGKPAILIPYPHAADNHQHKNGDHYAKGGGCIKVSEEDLTVEKLALLLTEMIENKEKRKRMANAMKQLGLPQATEKIADSLLGHTEKKNN